MIDELINYTDQDKIILFTQLDSFIKEQGLKIGMDKLKLCYNVIQDSIISELEAERPIVYELFDFTLYRVVGKYHNDIYSIVYNDLDENNEIVPTKFGELRFNLKSQDQEEKDKPTDCQKVWIHVENKILYDDIKVHYLPYIADCLGLELNNLTACEIYVDTGRRNMAYAMKSHIRNKKLTTYLNGKKITDRSLKRPELRFLHVGDMDRYKDMTLYIMPKKAINNKASAPTLCFYNKLDEIENASGKEYIKKKYNNPTKLFRSEVRFTNEKFKEFLEKYHIELNDIILFSKGFQWCVFEHFFNSIIYFKNGKDCIGIDTLVF